MFSSSHKSGDSSRTTSDPATVRIKCSFCGNTFHARPGDAVCPKCQRPANRDLAPLWRVLSFLLPLLGLGYALLIRAHSPLAANQGVKWSLGGLLFFSAPALLSALLN